MVGWYERARRSRLFDLMVFAGIVLAILVLLVFLPEPDPVEVSGQAHIIDGDSLRVAGTEIRLKGIDAPEYRQNCQRNGQSWACGEEAARKLLVHLKGRSVNCKGHEHDEHDRLLAICRTGDMDINEWLVANGWAVSYEGYPAAEQIARNAKKGIWSGTFTHPRDWREENR